MYPEMMTLRLDIAGLKYSVIHAFAAKSDEVQSEISHALDDVIKNFDFAACVRESASAVLREAIRAAVVSACVSACSSLMTEEPISSLIQAKVRAAIEESLR